MSSVRLSSLVKWVEHARFFARPKTIKQRDVITCEQASSLADFAYSLSSCREQAAYTCVTPDGFSWTGDACVCSTLDSYDSKFSACIHDTPYSECIDANNQEILSEWSSGHCVYSDGETPTAPIITTTPASIISTPDRPTTEPGRSGPPDSHSTPDSRPESSSPGPKSAEPSLEAPKASDAPKQSSDLPKSEKLSEAPMSTPTSVPQASLVPVTVAPHATAPASDSASSSFAVHVPLPKWTGTGNLLQSYCATTAYTLLDGATAYWAPVIGCASDKPDCCPYDIPASSQVVAAIVAQTTTAANSASAASVSGDGTSSSGGFPSALLPAQATLERCPDDYFSIGNGCCPSNYFPWSTAFGGQTPCYSTLSAAITPPPIPESLAGVHIDSTMSPKPTSAVVNVVYAMQYPVKPPSKSALTSNAKIGIGAGAGVAAVVFGILTFLLVWKHTVHKRNRAALESMSGIGSTRQSVAASSAAGGVKEWRNNIPSPAASRYHEGLEPIPEPTLPNVGMTQAHYPVEWRPGQRTVSPPIPPIPAAYSRNSPPSPPIPEGYSEVDSQHAMLDRRYSNNNTPGVGSVTSDRGYSNAGRSELQSGEYPFPRQELQGVPEDHGVWGHGGGHVVYQNAYPQYGIEEPRTYHEAPAGRMTPKMG